MKKGLSIFLFLALLFLFTENVYADTRVKVVSDVPLNVRKNPGTSGEWIRSLPTGTIVRLVSEKKYDGAGCSNGWYQIYYSSSDNATGYVCSTHVEPYENQSTGGKDPVTACEIELNNLGFPSSYWPGLCSLKEKYPNWTFIPDFTGISFSVAVAKQATGNRSYIQSNNSGSQGYLATDYLSYDYLTDKFFVKEGSNWYNANEAIIAYYMDPRNSFDEESMFMFEQLSFNSSYQTEDVVRAVLNGTDIAAESGTILNAGRTYNANAIYLASRIKLETTGMYNSISLKGPIYNPYNIGAYTGAQDGLNWASGNRGFGTPWDNLQKAINGGAEYIANGYINQGQDTTYFQKFNVSSYAIATSHSHQYQTNIQGPAIESHSTHAAYKKAGLLSTSFGFVIPIYEEMPESPAPEPTRGNPNNHLKDIKLDGISMNGFSHDIFEYLITTDGALSDIKISAEKINSKANVEIVEQSSNYDERVVTIKVTSENKLVQNYSLTFLKTDSINIKVDDIISNMGVAVNDNMLLYSAGITVEKLKDQVWKQASNAVITVENKETGLLATGDSVTIVNGTDAATFIINVKGDATGDGNINIQDLLVVQKHILGYSDLTHGYLKAGDVNNDGLVDIRDLLIIQKHILGYMTIS